MKTGLKYVVLVWPIEKPAEIHPFSNFRLACRFMKVNYNTFHAMKKKHDQATPIEVNGYMVERKQVEREYGNSADSSL